ncbi:MAG: Gfo/Idh/MocA family oxidoreductase [Phycisphaeraceae bacterium]|nr:Gfo/Idh/MocA family oxidoreductase [Phycisphaeraceae bacterium]
MSDQVWRAMLVGCGRMAEWWMRLIRETPSLEVVALVDVQRHAAEEMAQRHGLDYSLVYDTVEDALTLARPQVAFDVTVPAAHEEVTTKCLAAGCHVLGEKPISDTLDGARRMIAAAKKYGRVYAATQNRRFDPNIRAVRQFLDGGGLGEITQVDADFYIGAHFGGFRDQMEYPLLLDMAIHTFDAARFLTRADATGVYCRSFNPKGSWYKGDASAAAIFSMSKGIVFNYRGSWCAEGLSTTWESQWRIIGTKGTLTWDGAKGIKAQVIKPDGKHEFNSQMMDVEESTFAGVELKHTGHAGVVHDFLDALGEGREPESVGHDNFRSVAMCVDAVRSAKEGRLVEVHRE